MGVRRQQAEGEFVLCVYKMYILALHALPLLLRRPRPAVLFDRHARHTRCHPIPIALPITVLLRRARPDTKGAGQPAHFKKKRGKGLGLGVVGAVGGRGELLLCCVHVKSRSI